MFEGNKVKLELEGLETILKSPRLGKGRGRVTHDTA